MDSPQSVVSPFKGSSVFPEPEKQKPDHFTKNHGSLSEVQSKEAIGVLEVFIHQARDIHNICIYHKQDVYAKICLTNDPKNTVATQTINGGGQNPVFNEKLRINVQTIDASLKCEIFMLSRVRNYLEDQLLGFAMVPLSEVLVTKGNLEKEFSLSSSDLFDSPAGFVQLTLAYSGSSPDVIALPSAISKICGNSEESDSITSEFDKIEFPDPKIVNENDMMVTEYFEIQNSDLDSPCSESRITSDTHQIQPSSETVSTNGSTPSKSCETSGASKSPQQELVSTPDSKPQDAKEDVGDAESKANASEVVVKPVVTLPLEQNVVQQDFVDMYMKSMQQFTESLAKMKLPMDMESGPTSSEGSTTTDNNVQAAKTPGSRVFYGSRAFF